MQSAPVRFLIGLGYAMRSKRIRTTVVVKQKLNKTIDIKKYKGCSQNLFAIHKI